MNHTYSILFWINRAKINKNGQTPIYARVTVNGRRAEIATGRYIDSERWNIKEGAVKGNREDARSINSYLDSIKLKLNAIHQKLLEQNEIITADAIKNIYYGKTAKRHTLVEVFKYHNEQMKVHVGKEFAAGTYERYQTTLKLLVEFMKYQYGKEDMSLAELKYGFITDLEFWFKIVRKCSHNTTIKYITNLRKIINLAIVNEWLHHDLFAKFKVSLKEVKRECLSAEELQVMVDKSFKIDRLDQVKDIFVFCCYTGLAYVG